MNVRRTLGIAAIVLAMSLTTPPAARAQAVSFVFMAGQVRMQTGPYRSQIVGGAVVEGGSTSGTVELVQPAPSGGTTVNLTSSTTDVSVPASVVVSAGQRSVDFTATAKWGARGTATITAARAGSSSSEQTNLGVRAATVTGITLPRELGEGASAEGRVSLETVVGAGGATVNLTVAAGSGTDPGVDVTIPSSVTVAQGASEAVFTIAVAKPRRAAPEILVSAARPGVTQPTERSARIRVTTATVASLTFHPATVPEGGVASGTITLIPAAPGGGITVSLASSSGNVTVPASIAVAAGETSATFAATATGSGTARITAVRDSLPNAASKSTDLTVSRTQVGFLGVSPSTAIDGDTTTGTVSLDAAAGDGGVTIALSSSTAAATVPASVVVPKGTATATFKITAVSEGSAEIKAVRQGETAAKQATVTVTKNQVKSLALDVPTLLEGRSATGTVTLMGVAGQTAFASISRARIPAACRCPRS